MRVIAGKARRIPLTAPQGMNTRPTTDRTKETLFNMIQPYLADASFLDLFSGSGAIGIEGLSRGAEEAIFVENGKEASDCIVMNLKKTNLDRQGTLLKTSVCEAISRLDHEKKSFDVIFMDPPYNQEIEKEVLFQLSGSNLVTEDTLIIVEASLETTFDYIDDTAFQIDKEKKYKTNKHVFITLRE